MATVGYATPQGRWVLAAAVLGSGVAFLDSTVVNVALPAIGDDLGTSITGLQWTVDSYLVTLSALLLLGGSLGDRFGRRAMFVYGLASFTVASVLCGVAPSSGFLIAARGLQGVGGALLVPGSLAIIAATFDNEDRGRAVGAWAGLAGLASSVGPFLGGWLIDAVSWRLIFLINVPLAAVAAAIAIRHVPESRAPGEVPIDVTGALLVTASLAAIAFAAIDHSGADAAAAGVGGALGLLTFVAVERASTHPMLPLTMFRSAQFTGANLTTLAVYAGLSGGLFLVVLRLQVSLQYSALEAGAALTPFTVLMLVLSPRAGQLGQRIGARIPMTVGPIVAGVGLALVGRAGPGDHYVSTVLPGVVVFGTGMAITVAPLTSAVLASATDALAGVASGVNNAVARLAGLLAVAALPAVAGISTEGSIGSSLGDGYGTALAISAALCVAGGVIAAITVRETAPTRAVTHPSPYHACQHECVAGEERSAA